ncbi:MAG: hypothetical protein JRM80_09110 [Nitrososphaerota archaeon]|nr:hypothetical protein [Nitrososphaerota archaeon]
MKVTIISPRSEYGEVAKALAKFEDFHPAENTAESFDPGVQELTVKAVRLFSQADQAAKDLGLKLMPGQMDMVFGGVKVPRSDFEASTWEDLLDKADAQLSPIAAETSRLKAALQKAMKDEADTEALTEALQAVSGFSSDLTGISDLSLFRAVVSTVDLEKLEEFKNSLPGAILLSQPVSKERALVLVAVEAADETKLDKAMKLLELKPLGIPSDFPQNPAGAYRKAAAQHDAAVAEREKLEGQIAEAKERYATPLLAVRELTEAARSLLDEARVSGGMNRMAMFSGYVPAKRGAEMKEAFDRWIVHTEELDEPGEHTPTLMENSRWESVFRPITLEQGTPGRAEVDPTPIVSYVFPAFFGMMFGDVGHGLLLSLFMLFVRQRSTGSTRRWANIFLVAGISATLFGVLFGEFFELSLYSFVPIPAAVEIIHRVAGSPDTFYFSGTWSGVDLVLIVSVLIGVGHLTTALALDVYESVKEHNRIELFLERVPALTMYVSGVGYGLSFIGAGYTFNVLTSSAPNPLLAIPNNVLGAVSLAVLIPSMVVLFAGKGVAIAMGKLKEGSVAGALSNGGLEVFERISQFLSNTISYIRLGVMLLVHAALLLVVNMKMPLSDPVNIVPWVIFNLLILAFEALIVYIQDLRLHLYEFFTKFYPGSGVPFRKIFPDRARVKINWT